MPAEKKEKGRRKPQLSHWTRWRPRLCDECFATCCHNLRVEVSVTDLIRLGFLKAEKAADPQALSQITQDLAREGILRAHRRGSLVFALGLKPNKDCVFLDSGTRRCSVYGQRPEICRRFPKQGPRPGHCPYLPKDG